MYGKKNFPIYFTSLLCYASQKNFFFIFLSKFPSKQICLIWKSNRFSVKYVKLKIHMFENLIHHTGSIRICTYFNFYLYLCRITIHKSQKNVNEVQHRKYLFPLKSSNNEICKDHIKNFNWKRTMQKI